MIEYVIIIFLMYLFIINVITNIETFECQDPYTTIKINNNKIAVEEKNKINNMNINTTGFNNINNLQNYIINNSKCDEWPKPQII